MGRRSGTTTVWVTLAVLAATASGAEAQRRPGERFRRADPDPVPRAWVSVGLAVADPVGELDEVIDEGIGLEASGALPLGAGGALALRGDLGFVIYGHERQTVCFSPPIGCRIGVDLETSNTIAFGEIGPEITATSGSLRPYVHASVGFSYFATTSSLSGVDEWDTFGNTRNFSDVVGSVGVGGGIRTRLKGGPKPVYLDLGLMYRYNGEAEYLREGDIEDHADGSITIHPNRSEANLFRYRLGVTFGIPRAEDRDRRRR